MSKIQDGTMQIPNLQKRTYERESPRQPSKWDTRTLATPYHQITTTQTYICHIPYETTNNENENEIIDIDIDIPASYAQCMQYSVKNKNG